MDQDETRHPVAAKVESGLERTLFVGRWLLAPVYLGLLVGLAVVVVAFFKEVVHMVGEIGHVTGSIVALEVLNLIDLTLIGNLIVIVILSGFETFVSRIHAADRSPDKPRWMGKIDFGGLKLRLIGSLVAISAIRLLEDFLRADGIKDFTPIAWQIGIHLTFVVSGLAFALTDLIASRTGEEA